MRNSITLLVLAFSLACTPTSPSDDTGALDQRINDAEPGGVLQLELPEATIPAGADTILCFIPAEEIAQDVLASAFESVHAPIATHVDAMVSLIPRQPNQAFDCANPQMLA